jgi:hypothetical protein
MKYLLLIYTNEAQDQAQTEQQKGEIFQQYMDFTDQIQASKQLVAGDALLPTPTAKTVRVTEGNMLITDGPFAETREALGGYYLVDVDSEEQALALAAKIPAASHGCVEVRPVMVFDMPSL